jgi:hypothetical protein
MTGTVRTVTDTALDAIWLHAPVTMQSYVPALAALSEANESVADVAPETFASLRRHWYVIGPAPVAATESDRAWPTHASTGPGWTVMTVAALTVSVAAELVVLPQPLVTTQS